MTQTPEQIFLNEKWPKGLLAFFGILTRKEVESLLERWGPSKDNPAVAYKSHELQKAGGDLIKVANENDKLTKEITRLTEMFNHREAVIRLLQNPKQEEV